MNKKTMEGGIEISGRVRWIAYKAGTKEVVGQSEWKNNLIMFGTNTGRDLILKRLIGDNTYSLNILYADIGTGTNTPAISDTTLQTAIARAGSPVTSQSGNTVSLQFFWPDASLANGSYTEFATFVDGSATVSTGKIFNRILFATAFSKTSGIDTTVQIDFTITT